MKTIARTALIALSLTTTAFASAQGVRVEKNMSLELATQLASVTVAACSAAGYNVSATVVDHAGGVRAVMRADNAGPHTLEASRLKAFTSASAKSASGASSTMSEPRAWCATCTKTAWRTKPAQRSRTCCSVGIGLVISPVEWTSTSSERHAKRTCKGKQGGVRGSKGK